MAHTVRPKSSDPFYTVTYYTQWVTTSYNVLYGRNNGTYIRW